jgi:uncharacterized SAM-binding protein YcdF (DUF218 family)
MRMVRWLILVAGIVATLWLAGFWTFVQSIETLDTVPIDQGETDAIVVLTGGSERLGAGIELLDAHKGKKLFISGVHPGLTPEHLLGDQPVSRELRACCIALGYAAGSTFGNALETRAWMESEQYQSLRLVTANYHMPRSLLIFRKLMPDFAIIPHPIAPDDVKLGDWWQRPGTASLLAFEYNKYLLAVLRLWLDFQ